MRLFSHLVPPQESHPVDRLLELLGTAVQFVYTCWDRIVVTGYIERLQRPENLVYFFHDLVGVACIEPAVLEQRTAAYRAWVRRVTDEQAIPVLAAPRGVRKDDNAFLGVADVDALQAAADRLSAAVVQRRCAYWVRRLVPVFSPAESAALQPGYRYSMAQMELATDIVFRRSAPLKALFQRACELGILVGGAERTTHLFGRRINRRYQGKLQTVLDQRETGHPVLRW